MAPLESAEDVLEALQAFSPAAALGAALELGLPWLLESGPLDDAAIAAALGIPPSRCRWWLRVLVRLGLLVRVSGGYFPSAGARRAILDTYRRESWAFLAREERERFPTVIDLTARLTLPAAPSPPSAGPGNYVSRMAADPERARAFTRMLYDLHGSLAESLAAALDLSGARRLLDLGGGSGVMSLALLRRNPALTAVVADIANVCEEGRRVARECSLEDRITFLEADLLGGALPGGFDVVLECDVGVYDEVLFSGVRAALAGGGRFAIADLLAEFEGDLPSQRLHWQFTASVSGREEPPMTWGLLRQRLERCGFRLEAETTLSEGFRLLVAEVAATGTP